MNLSYNISEHIKSNLIKVEELRHEILLFPLSSKDELRLKWEATIDKIYWSLALSENPLSKRDIGKIISGTNTKNKISKYEIEALDQRSSFNYIRQYWLVTNNLVDMTIVKKLYQTACKGIYGPMSGLTSYSEKRIISVFDYLQKGQDHPIIQAGIIQPEIIAITPFDNGNNKIARLLSYLYLYRGGYDIREMFNLEEYYKSDTSTYKKMLSLTRAGGNMTFWLEYFTYGVKTQLEKSLENIKKVKFQDENRPTFWKLNDRQRQILEILNNPEGRMTNKDVQKHGKVSQITASRDLAKLVSLGLLLAHGKGRSVFYTRV